MKLKKKRKRVWCKEQPLHLPGEGAEGKRYNNKVHNRRTQVQTLPNKVKCPDCGKKFKPRIRECGDPYCWHVWIPAHKKME